MLKLVGRLIISSPQLNTQGEINKVSWMVGTDHGSEISDFPDKIEGGQFSRAWIVNSGYFGKVISLGNKTLKPLKLTYNALTKKDVEKLQLYYTRRKYVIAEYREFQGKLARITNMKVNPVRNTKYTQVTLTIVEVPAFRVYRSTDYGETYQQASDRVGTEFFDYGFIYAGQVRYRIQYEPPDGSSKYDEIEVFGETETLRISRVDITPSEPYDLPVANVSGSMKIADTLITGGITEPTPAVIEGFYHEYLPVPEIDHVESHRLYTTEGIKPAIKVFLKYPTNAFVEYPDTAITKEYLSGTISKDTVTTQFIFEGFSPFVIQVPSTGETLCKFIFSSENIYGKSSDITFETSFNIPELPPNDKWVTGALNTGSFVQEIEYTKLSKKFVNDTILLRSIEPENLKEIIILHVPPGMEKKDGGRFMDTLNTQKNVYMSDFEENSVYDDIHYT